MPPEQLEAGQEAGAARRHLSFHLSCDGRASRLRIRRKSQIAIAAFGLMHPSRARWTHLVRSRHAKLRSRRANPPDRYRRGDANRVDCLLGFISRAQASRPRPHISRDTQTHQKERGKKRAPGSDGGVPTPGKTQHGAEKDEPVGESGRPFRGEPDASYLIDHSEQKRIRRAIKGLEITVRQFSLQNLLGDKPAAFPHPSAKSAVGTPPKTWPARTRAIAAITPNSIFAAVLPPRSSVVEAA